MAALLLRSCAARLRQPACTWRVWGAAPAAARLVWSGKAAGRDELKRRQDVFVLKRTAFERRTREVVDGIR